jgi:hypothetical protein
MTLCAIQINDIAKQNTGPEKKNGKRKIDSSS